MAEKILKSNGLLTQTTNMLTTQTAIISTVDVSLPEKRRDLGQGPIPEQPLEKRPKLDDPAMDLQSNSNSDGQKKPPVATRFLCEICHVNGHNCWGCPRRSTGMGWYCFNCHGYGPCKKKDDDPHDHVSVEMVKQCVVCGHMGNHWAEDCPFRSDAEEDDPGTIDSDDEDDGNWI